MTEIRLTWVPCPFCGSDQVRLVVEGFSCLQCEQCSAKGPTYYRATAAIEGWNERAKVEDHP